MLSGDQSVVLSTASHLLLPRLVLTWRFFLATLSSFSLARLAPSLQMIPTETQCVGWSGQMRGYSKKNAENRTSCEPWEGNVLPGSLGEIAIRGQGLGAPLGSPGGSSTPKSVTCFWQKHVTPR